MIKTRLFSNQFLRGGAIVIIGSQIFNFGQLAYHFFARLLGKSYYGDLASFISILGIFGILQTSFGLAIIKFIAVASPKDTQSLIKWFYKKSIQVGLVISAGLLVLSPLLASFLNITQPYIIYLLPPTVFFYILLTIGRSILQGRLKFDKFVLSLFAELTIKVLLTFVLIILGYAVFGAIVGMCLGIIAAWVLTHKIISSELIVKVEKAPQLRDFFKFSGAALIQGLSFTAFFTTDLLLVKHFFSAEQAGIYASISTLGKIVLYIGTPVTTVMFPFVAQKFHKNEGYRNIFLLCFSLLILLSSVIVLIYYTMPQIVIGLLFGKNFIEGVKFLWWYGLFMMLLSIAMFLTQFYLSIGKTKVVILFGMGAIAQAVLIWIFHSSLLLIIQLSIICCTLLNLGLLIYFPYVTFRNRSSLQAR